MIPQNLQIQTGSNLMKDTSLYHRTSLEASHFYLRSAMEQEIRGDLTSLKPLEYFNPITNEWLIEQFKPIKDYEGLYEISNLGRVKSLQRLIRRRNGRVLPVKENILGGGRDTRGYVMVILQKYGQKKTCKVHHLVWDNFSETPRDGMQKQIDHKNNIKIDNRFVNLQLLTNRENCSKGKILSKNNGLPTGIYWYKRDKKYRAQIQINGKIRFIGYFKTIKEASEAYQNKLREINNQLKETN